MTLLKRFGETIWEMKHGLDFRSIGSYVCGGCVLTKSTGCWK